MSLVLHACRFILRPRSFTDYLLQGQLMRARTCFHLRYHEQREWSVHVCMIPFLSSTVAVRAQS